MERVFSEGRIGALRLPNRLIRSATAERMATAEGLATEGHISMYRALAAGGAGLVIAGHSYIRADGRAGPTMAGLHDDRTIPGWRRVVDAVHAEGGLIAAQINHGGRQSPPALVGTPRAPSAVALGEMIPLPFTDAEIIELIDSYVAAARRAVAAGFDAIQIHSAHGYLLSSFNSPFTNRREDRWGGDWAGRARTAREVIRAVRRLVGPEYPLLMKMNATDGIAAGISLADATRMGADFASAGLDAIEISGGSADAPTVMSQTIRPGGHEAYFAAEAAAVRAAVSIPVITVGGIRSYEVANRVLEDGTADFVALCRPFIREPDLPRRWAAGDRRPAACISCNLCRKYPQQGLRCETLAQERN
jgi:2,4-dienoyl-CoA reductase-like NADH-dependent reductase (Old Yellow Enzyme family)